MATMKYKVGDIVKRKNGQIEWLIEKIGLGYYTLSNVYCPSSMPSWDRSCSAIDNERIYEFVRHMSKKEFEATINRQLHQ